MAKTNKDFMKTLAFIAIPITIQSVLQSSLGMIDQLMVGQLGETAINAVGFGTKLSFIFLLAMVGITSATSIFAAQYWGAKDKEKIGNVLGITISVASIIAIIAMILSVVFPHLIMGLFTKDKEIINLGADYMRIIAIGLIPLVIVNAHAAVLRSCGDAKTPMITGFICVVTNTILNYLLIFGIGQLGGMGIKGAAIATSISRLLECFLILYLFHRKNLLQVKIAHYFKFNKKLVALFITAMLPLLINEALWGIGDTVFAAIYGHIGGAQTAGMISTFPIQGLAFGLMSGVGAASGIVLGNLLGEGESDQAFEYGKKFIKLGIVLSGVIGILVVIVGRYYIDLMNISVDAKGYALKVINVFAMILWIKVSNMIIGGGILRSGGKTKIVLILEMIGMWGIGVPTGLAIYSFTNFSIEWVYFFVSIEELFRMVVGLKIFHNKSWMSNINDSIEGANTMC